MVKSSGVIFSSPRGQTEYFTRRTRVRANIVCCLYVCHHLIPPLYTSNYRTAQLYLGQASKLPCDKLFSYRFFLEHHNVGF